MKAINIRSRHNLKPRLASSVQDTGLPYPSKRCTRVVGDVGDHAREHVFIGSRLEAGVVVGLEWLEQG